MIRHPQNELLCRLAPLIRPLQRELGNAFKIHDAYVGIAFRQTAQHAIAFAEFVPASDVIHDGPYPEGEYSNDEYTFDTSLSFINKLLMEAPDQFSYDVESPGNREIDDEIKTRWVGCTQVEVFRVALMRAECGCHSAAYIVSRALLNHESCVGLATSASLISQVLRSSLFLAEAMPEHQLIEKLCPLARSLSDKLPKHFAKHEEHFLATLDELGHPGRTYTKLFSTCASPEIESMDLPIAPEDRGALEAIRSASKVTIIGEPEGSLQRRRIFLAQLKSRDPLGQPTEVTLPAIIKIVSRDASQREATGYQLAQLFYNALRPVLPPPTVHWSQAGSDNWTAVTPQVEGEPLFQQTPRLWGCGRWEQPSRVDRFSAIFQRVIRFIDGFGQAAVPNNALTLQKSLMDTLSDTQVPGEVGVVVTLDALKCLEIVEKSPLLEHHNIAFINPRWFALNPSQHEWFEGGERLTRLVYYGHNDLHLGNILYDAHQDKITIIDFERAGVGIEGTDRALLEVTFLLSVASDERFGDESVWIHTFGEVLKALAVQHQHGSLPPALNVLEEGFDLWKTCQEIRVGMDEEKLSTHRYRMASALIKMLRAYHRKFKNQGGFERNRPGMFAVAAQYLGLILAQLVATSEDLKPVQMPSFFNKV